MSIKVDFGVQQDWLQWKSNCYKIDYISIHVLCSGYCMFESLEWYGGVFGFLNKICKHEKFLGLELNILTYCKLFVFIWFFSFCSFKRFCKVNNCHLFSCFFNLESIKAKVKETFVMLVICNLPEFIITERIIFLSQSCFIDHTC